MRILRIFPRRTNATPTDPLAIVDRLPNSGDSADRIEVSVTFDWDMAKAEKLAQAWRVVAPVEIGGPAAGSPAGDYVPGKYLREGYVITSRGCPWKCQHCKVPVREGALRLLPIRDGWNVLDNNLLACPPNHVRAVFGMLSRQSRRARFTGGFEAARVQSWHIDWLLSLRFETLWMAYDSLDDFDPLWNAVQLLREAGIVAAHKRKRVGAYVLIGRRDDTPEKAEARLRQVIALGIRTQAMLYDNGRECRPEDMQRWRDLRKKFTNAAEVGAMVAETWHD